MRKCISKARLIIGLMTATAFAGSASADFMIIGNDAYINSAAAAAQERQIQENLARLNRAVNNDYSVIADNRERPLIEHNRSPEHIPDEIHGFGMNMPLSEALLMVTPKDWIVYLHHDIQTKPEINWKTEHGGQEWTGVLRNMMADLNYTAEVYWPEQTITIREARYTQTRQLRTEAARITDSQGNTFYITQDEPIGAGSVLINGIEYRINFEEE